MEAYNLTKPLMFFSELFCVVPFSLDSKGKTDPVTYKPYRKGVFYYLRMFAILTIVVGCLIYQQIVISVYNSKNAIGNAVEFAHYNGRLIGTVLSVLLINFYNGHIVSFMNSLSLLERNVKDLGFRVDYSKISSLSYAGIAVILFKSLCMAIPYLVEEFYKDYLRILDCVVFSLPLLLIHIMSQQWILYLALLKVHVRALNEVLKVLKYRHCWVVGDFVKNSNGKSVKMLNRCGDFYSELCEGGRSVNEAFSWQFLIILPVFFTEIVLKSFNICQTIKNRTPVQPVMVTSDIVHFLVVLEIVVPCVIVKGESAKFVDALSKVDINHEDDAEFDEVMSALMLQAYHQKIEFSANGVFSIDGTLIYSILGALTTYLVILLQFDI